MIKLNRGKTEKVYSEEFILERAYVEMNETEINIEQVNDEMIDYFQNSKSILNIYFKNITSRIDYLLSEINPEREELKSFEKISIINSLKKLTLSEKYEILIHFAKTSDDYIKIEETINYGLINPDNLIKRFLLNE